VRHTDCPQAHRFQQDSSWHSGATVHGGSGLPTFLSQEQVQALQADPSAAASMVLQRPGGGAAGSRSGGSASPVANGAGGIAAAMASISSGAGGGAGAAGFEGGPAAECDGEAEIGRRGRGQQSVPLMMATSRSIVLPPGVEPAGGSSSTSAVRRAPASAGTRSHGDLARQEVGLARSAESCSATAAAYVAAPSEPAFGGGRSRGAAAGASAPLAAGSGGGSSIMRSASAVFEHDGSTGVYMAADGAGGQAGLMPNPPPGVTRSQPGHFGSAPGADLAAAAAAGKWLSGARVFVARGSGASRRGELAS
jgi:hypothetical protein